MGGIKRRKAVARLQRRIKAWQAHGQNPRAPANPSNAHGDGHDMHKPGSLKK